MDFIDPKIEAYAAANSSPETEALQHLSRETHLKTYMPRMLSGHLQGRVLSLLSQAAGMRGDQKLRALLEALEVADRGEYLPGTRSEWVERRRQELELVLSDARCEAAEVALAAGRYRQAGRLADMVLRGDRYQERAWRLRMRLAHVHGDQHRLLAAYHACEQALQELGTPPSSATVALLQDLRR